MKCFLEVRAYFNDTYYVVMLCCILIWCKFAPPVSNCVQFHVDEVQKSSEVLNYV